MQEKKLKLRRLRIGSLPILNRFIERMRLRDELGLALGNADYADAILALMKNVLVEHGALYTIQEWADLYAPKLVSRGKLGDDRLARALDRLFVSDRATLQTRVVLAMMKGFGLKMERIHNDSTSVSVYGDYEAQNPKAVALKQGHSKDHRPDLKQLVYSLCITSDGAVPVHFKAYDGNQMDDGIHLQIWQDIRTLLQHPKFIYVADCKLCTEKNLRAIDRAHGLFVTVVPKTRAEVTAFTEALLAGDVRWGEILRKRADPDKPGFDVIDCAEGLYQLKEGFTLYWYRSSHKKKRDAEDRDARIARAIEKLETMDLRRSRGPKTEATINKRVEQILAQCGASDWVTVDLKWDDVETFKAVSRGKPTTQTKFLRTLKKVPRLHIGTDAEAIARSQVMDGIFPLTTNTKEQSVDIYKIYKYQPHIEKRHAMLKSTFAVAPIWLKKNKRIEALMFVAYLAQTVAALIERELRQNMAAKKIATLKSLPEGRPSKTPTIEQIIRLFKYQNKQELYDGKRLVKTFVDPLSEVQSQIIQLLDIPKAAYIGHL